MRVCIVEGGREEGVQGQGARGRCVEVRMGEAGEIVTPSSRNSIHLQPHNIWFLTPHPHQFEQLCEET